MQAHSAQPPLLPVAGPWITEHELGYVADAAANAWYASAHAYHDRFEAAFAAHCKRRHAIALPSGTSALHLALAALGVGPGDEVIVPDLTWVACAAAIGYLGATPVCVDVDPVTWCLDPAAVVRAVTPRTRAVMPVGLYGGMPQMDALGAIARTHSLALVEDAAQALGSRWGDRPAGSFGDASIFSFHGSKTLTTGEGGMLVTDSDALYARALVLRDHGRHPADPPFWCAEVGYKYRMSSMQAAMGLAQLERLDALVERKRAIFGWYRARLAGVPGLTFNAEPAGTFNSYWMTTVVWDASFRLSKETVRLRLRERGVDSRPVFYPLTSLPPYAGLAKQAPVAYDLAPRGLNLPSALVLTEADVDRACTALMECLLP